MSQICNKYAIIAAATDSIIEERTTATTKLSPENSRPNGVLNRPRDIEYQRTDVRRLPNASNSWGAAGLKPNPKQIAIKMLCETCARQSYYARQCRADTQHAVLPQ